MSGYRSHPQLIADLLTTVREGQAVDEGARLTKVLRKTNLPYKRMTEMLEKLMNSGLLDVDLEGKQRRYQITDRGMEYILEYNRFKDYASIFGLKV